MVELRSQPELEPETRLLPWGGLAYMDSIIANDAPRDKPATVKRETFNIILGCHRLQGCTLDEVLAMALNGCGYVRRGNEFTLFSSPAFEQIMPDLLPVKALS